MRQAINIEVRGLKTPRERVWEALLQAGADKARFDRLTVQDLCAPLVRWTAVEDYLQALEKAGFIKVAGTLPATRGKIAQQRFYVWAKKPPGTAPRLTKKGGHVRMGDGNEAMWRAMKVLAVFDYTDIAKAATLGDVVVRPQTAKTYLNALARAGYLDTLRHAKPGTPARHTLRNNTGPHAPAVTRLKTVFDRNTGHFAHLQTAQEVCDGIE